MRTVIGEVITAAAVAAVAQISPVFAAPAGPHWEAVKAEVPAGRDVRLDVRLVGADGKPVTGNVDVTQTRLDMGPDKMQMMTSAVRQVASSQPGIMSFVANLSPGHWALTLNANVAGQTQSVTGQVVFTAAAPR